LNIHRNDAILANFDNGINADANRANFIYNYGNLTGSYRNKGGITVGINSIQFQPKPGYKANDRLQFSFTKGITTNSGAALSNPQVVNYRVLPDTGYGEFGDSLSVGISSLASNPGVLYQLADMDNNGTIDYMVYDSLSGQGVFYPRSPDANPINYKFAPGASFMHLADLRSDGYPDLILVLPGNSSLAIYDNSANGFDQSPLMYGLQATPLMNNVDSYVPMSDDIDADGDLDIVVSCKGSLTVLINSGFGGDYSTKLVTQGGTGSANNAFFMDVDNDGDLDIGTEGLAIYLNDGTGSFAYKSSLNVASVISQEDVDMNNDGYVDIVQLVKSTGVFNLQVYFNKQGGGFSLVHSYPMKMLSSEANAITSGDFDGDGYMDIVLTSNANKSFIYLLNDNSGGLGAPKIHYGDQQEGVWAADMDDDGDVDVISMTNVKGSKGLILNTYLNQKVCHSFIVSSVDDYGPNDQPICGTLRYAITAADQNLGVKDTIRFAIPPSLGHTINITQGYLDISEAVVILGPGKDSLTIYGTSNSDFRSRLFDFEITGSSTDTSVISGLTIENAINTSSGYGGAITFNGKDLNGAAGPASLIVKNCRVQNNTSSYGGAGLYFRGLNLSIDSSEFEGNQTNATIYYEGGDGAGASIYSNAGKVLIENSTFSNNSGTYNTSGYNYVIGSGNGVYLSGTGFTSKIEDCTFANNKSDNGGAISFTSSSQVGTDSLAIVNSTFSGNVAQTSGAGLYSTGAQASVYLQNITMANNGLDSLVGLYDIRRIYYTTAGGLYVNQGALTTVNSIIALNQAKNVNDIYIEKGVTFTSKGGNFFGTIKSNNTLTLQSTDITKGDPLLSPLANNGGMTQTLMPLPGSSVVNKGVKIASTTQKDQRGDTRIVGSIVDIGAVESQSPTCGSPFYVTNTSDGYECGSLRLAVYMANLTAGEQTITFAPSLKGDSIVLGSVLAITEGLTMKGLPGLAISGGNSTNLINSTTSYDTSQLNFSHLIFRNSYSRDPAINHYGRGNLSFVNCDIVQNYGAYIYGAGLYVERANLRLDSCHILYNYLKAADGGYGAGVYYSDSANNTLSINHSSFIGNTCYNASGGGMFVRLNDSTTKVTIQNSSFEGNSAYSGSALYLNAPYGSSKNGYSKIINTTFSRNVGSTGGAIYSDVSALAILNSTIFKNGSQSTNPNYNGIGGGIYLSSSKLTIQNTIVAKNSCSNSYGKDILSESGVNSLGNNFVSDSIIADASYTGWVKTDTLGSTSMPIDPQLDTVLALNGGFTRNHLPLQASPVIDRGNSTTLLPLVTDQRGHARIYSKAMDIGSVEYDGVFPFPLVYAGKDTTTCDSTKRIKASPVYSPFKGYWTVIGQKAKTFLLDSTQAITTAKLLLGTNLFVWNVTDGKTTKRDTLKVVRSGFPKPAILTLAKEACSDTFILKLMGTDTYKWRIANQKAPDTLKILSQTSQKVGTATEVYSTVGNYKTGVNKIVLSSSNVAGCLHTDTTTLTYYPGKPFAGFDTTVYADTVKLHATQYLQNQVPVKGSWHVLSGKSSLNDSTLLRAVAKKLTAGANQFQYILATTCKQKDSVTVTYVYVSDTAKAGTDQFLCQDSTSLFGSKPAIGAKGKWTILNSTVASLVNDTLFNTKLRKIPKDTLKLVWTITVTKSQKVSRDTVLIVNNLSTVKAIAGTYAVVPYDTVTLKGNVDGTSTSRWRRLTGNGIFQDSTAHTTKVNNLSIGLNKFLYVFTGVCPRYDTAKVTFTLPVVKTFAGQDQKVCTDTASLTATAVPVGKGYVGVWRNLSPSNGVLSDSTNVKTHLSGLITGKDTLVWVVKSGKFIVGSDTVVITKLLAPNAQVIGSVKNGETYMRTCNSSTTISAMTVAIGDTGIWTTTTTKGNTINAPKSVSTVVSNLNPFDSTSGPDKFIWTVHNSTCSKADTLNVYYAIVVYTVKDKDSIIAGQSKIVHVVSNDIYSIGDSLEVVPIDFVVGPNQPITNIIVRKDTTLEFFTNAKKLTNQQVFTYKLYNNCPNSKASQGYVFIKTINIPPNQINVPISTTSGKVSSYAYPLSLFDNNPNIDSLSFDSSNTTQGKISVHFNPDTTQLIVEWDYTNVPSFVGTETFRFYVYDRNQSGKVNARVEEIITFTVTEKNSNVTVYNALSPNGDGKNDVVEIDNIDLYPNNKFKVFNRWGDKVYAEDGYNGKDVAFTGGNLPDGTYYYVLELGDGSKPIEGFILLKR
jgi:gliding motility-associated-like protein